RHHYDQSPLQTTTNLVGIRSGLRSFLHTFQYLRQSAHPFTSSKRSALNLSYTVASPPSTGIYGKNTSSVFVIPASTSAPSPHLTHHHHCHQARTQRRQRKRNHPVHPSLRPLSTSPL